MDENIAPLRSLLEYVRSFYHFTLICLFFGILSCQPEEQILTTNPDARLRFSADSVLFDTVFSAVPTITRRLKIYNDNNGAINITSISLGGGGPSPFNLTVNGGSGDSFKDIRLLKGDSMLILIDALIDPQDENNPFVVEDSILFRTNGNNQQVILAAWAQDAIYLQDSILICNTLWTNERPYVIYNSVLVDSLCSLKVEAGAKIFSHKGSFIYIKGSLDVQGEPDNRVTFLNDRLDEKFQNAPGQWEGIYFLEGSKNNRMNFADIRNSVYGIWLGTPDNDTIPDLILNGVRVENMSKSGIIAFTSDLRAVNTLVNNCLDYSVANIAGGNYRYEHCTFANFSTIFFRENPLFAVTDNLVLSNTEVIIDNVNLSLVNSIIWGDMQNEILLNNDGGAIFNVTMDYSILKTTLATGGDENKLNIDPLFLNPFGYDYHLDSLSPAVNAGLPLNIFVDFDGLPRDTIPDLGAYEWKPTN